MKWKMKYGRKKSKRLLKNIKSTPQVTMQLLIDIFRVRNFLHISIYDPQNSVKDCDPCLWKYCILSCPNLTWAPPYPTPGDVCTKLESNCHFNIRKFYSKPQTKTFPSKPCPENLDLFSYMPRGLAVAV